MAGKINVAALVAGLDNIHKVLMDIAPIASAIGGPIVANVATIGIAATATIQNVLERGDKLKSAMTEQDEAKLRAMLADIQKVNDELAGAIAEPPAEPSGGSEG